MFDNAAQLNLMFNGKTGIDCPLDKIPKIEVPENAELILSLDPSSSQTGIVLGDCEHNVFLLGDFVNVSKVLSKAEYSVYLKDYLKRLTDVYPIKYFVYEVPFTASTQDLARSVLSFLENTFKEYSKYLNGLTIENCYPILPGVWRKTYFSDKKYTGRKKTREDLKLIAQEKAIEIYPEYSLYLSQKNIPDCTDALGVYHGFIEENWFDFGQSIYRVSKVNSRYSRNHDVDFQVREFDSVMGSVDNVEDIKLFCYNSEYSAEETASIVTSNTNKTCFVLPMDHTARNLLMWDCVDSLNDDQTVVLVCKRKNELRELK